MVGTLNQIIPEGKSLGPDQVPEVLADWLDGFAARTAVEYRRDLDWCARVSGYESAERFVVELLDCTKGAAELVGRRLLNASRTAGHASATTERRIAVVRSLSKFLHRLDLVAWTIETPLPDVEPRIDMRGPTLAQARAIWQHLIIAGEGPDAQRERLLFRLCWDMALRTHEICDANVEDYEPSNGKFWARGKGQSERHRLPVPSETARELDAWLGYYHPSSPTAAGSAPLITGVMGARLIPRVTRDIVARWGDAIGIRLSPHRIRHSTITAALSGMGGDVRTVAAWARHHSVSVTLAYDDARHDRAGSAAKVAAALIGGRELPDDPA